MAFPTPEIEQELQRIRAELLADNSPQLQSIGETATDLQLYLLSQSTLLDTTRERSEQSFTDLLKGHSKLAVDIETAADMGLVI
jgi:hypothetical protein